MAFTHPFQITQDDVDRSSTLDVADIGKWCYLVNGCYQGFHETQAKAAEAIEVLQTPDGFQLAFTLTPYTKIYYNAGSKQGTVQSLEPVGGDLIRINFRDGASTVVGRKHRFQIVKRAVSAQPFRTKPLTEQGVSLT